MGFSPASITVDRTSPVPLYYQVAQRLEHAIESGDLPAGTRLDNELVLADQLGVSRPTLRRAIGYLVDRGYVVRRRAVGTQVVQPKVRRPVQLSSLYDDLATGGKNPRTKVLSLETVAAADLVAHALGVRRAARWWPWSGCASPTASRWRSCATGCRLAWWSWTPRPSSGPGSTSSCAPPAWGCTWRRRPSGAGRRPPPRPGCCTPARASRCSPCGGPPMTTPARRSSWPTTCTGR